MNEQEGQRAWSDPFGILSKSLQLKRELFWEILLNHVYNIGFFLLLQLKTISEILVIAVFRMERWSVMIECCLLLFTKPML